LEIFEQYGFQGESYTLAAESLEYTEEQRYRWKLKYKTGS